MTWVGTAVDKHRGFKDKEKQRLEQLRNRSEVNHSNLSLDMTQFEQGRIYTASATTAVMDIQKIDTGPGTNK